MAYFCKKLLPVLFIIITSSLAIFSSVYGDALSTHFFEKTLTLQANASTQCENAIGNSKLRVEINYWYNKRSNTGLGSVFIENGSPIFATLYRAGLSDRIAFQHYFSPMMPIDINNHYLPLYATIFNLCFSGNKQVAVEISLNASTNCLLTTPAWNYCR